VLPYRRREQSWVGVARPGHPPRRGNVGDAIDGANAKLARAITELGSLVVDACGTRHVHKSGYIKTMTDDDSRMNVRDVRAHFAAVITRAQNGSPTVIMRNGEPVAAVVPIEDFNVLEDAIDRYFSREADRDLADSPDAPTYSMSEVVAALFEESTGQGAA